MKKNDFKKDEYDKELPLRKRETSATFYFVSAIIFLLAVLFRLYRTDHYGFVSVDGSSMENTFVDGETLLLRYGTNAKRGDVIVVDVRAYKEGGPKENKVENPFGDTEFLIKRLIAIEGDCVKCEGGVVYVRYAGTAEYVALEEDYIKDGNSDFGEYEVGENEIFFLGDNRRNSLDSRYNEQAFSHLSCLYERDDIYGVVPEWVVEHRGTMRLFFGFRLF